LVIDIFGKTLQMKLYSALLLGNSEPVSSPQQQSGLYSNTVDSGLPSTESTVYKFHFVIFFKISKTRRILIKQAWKKF